MKSFLFLYLFSIVDDYIFKFYVFKNIILYDRAAADETDAAAAPDTATAAVGRGRGKGGKGKGKAGGRPPFRQR